MKLGTKAFDLEIADDQLTEETVNLVERLMTIALNSEMQRMKMDLAHAQAKLKLQTDAEGAEDSST